MRILIIDDEVDLVKALRQLLADQNYVTDAAYDGESGLDMARSGIYELFIVDVMLPRLSGYDLTRTLREEGNTAPILLLTARDGVDDRVEGLDSGADDYLVKPFSMKELFARVRALTRRPTELVGVQTLDAGGFSLDLLHRFVTFQGNTVSLTHKEFQLIELFMRNPGRVLTKEVILDRVWGYDAEVDSNVIEVYIGFIRKKLESCTTERGADDRVSRICTVRGVGYVFRGN